MRVPDKFPEGCRFAVSSGAEAYAEFPDGRIFKLSEAGTLFSVAELPRTGDFVTEAWFLEEARALAAAASR
jgi:hypothetical protein